MQFKKTLLLFGLTAAALSGCNDADKTFLLANSNYTLYGDLIGSPLFVETNVDDFTNLYNSNLNFIVMFSEDGCPACERFTPIIEEYVKETHQLVVNVTGNNKYSILEKFKDKFFPDENILNPSIFIKEKGDEIYKVNYSSYMITYRAFKRHMDSRYKTSKCAYFCPEIPGKSPIISNYTYVSFTGNSTFRTKLSDKLLSTEKNVIVESNNEANYLTNFVKNSDGNFEIEKTHKIDGSLTDEIINEYL